MQAFKSVGSEPNPHALAALVKASETYAIVASRDIVDVRGIKLWAQGQPVSHSLHRRLLDRRLEHPLEVCLQAEEGVTPFSLLNDLGAFIDGEHALSACVRPWGQELIEQVKHLPLHPVVLLMLTAAMASRPHTLPHAVAGMAVAGAMMASRQGSSLDIRLAMLGGLLHDLGEVYIDPQYLDYTQPLDLMGHKHLVVHPRVSQLLLSSLTDYPRALCRAVGEHHERLDRSGYPARLAADEISPLGRLLAVTEVALGVAHRPVPQPSPMAHAGFALRVVPGEFDEAWASFICEAAQRACEPVAAQADAPLANLAEQLANIDRRLTQARELADALQEQRRAARVTDVVLNAQQRLDRLRLTWNDLGLWAINPEEATPTERHELEMAHTELRQRMRCFQRECLLLSEGLTEAEKLHLSPLWAGLLAPA
jgi:hypothetical protein